MGWWTWKLRWKLLGGTPVGILVMVVVLHALAWPPGYVHGAWWTEAGWQKLRRFPMCKYQLQPGYEYVAYRDGFREQRHLLLFQHTQSKQTMVLCNLTEFPNVDSHHISVDVAPLKDTFRGDRTHVHPTLTIGYLLVIPSFRQEVRIPPDPTSVTVQGLEQSQRETFGTPTTSGVIFTGWFRRVGLVRPQPTWARYAIPYFDFKRPGHGAVAFITEKTTGKTLIAVAHNGHDGQWDPGAFVAFVRSVTFATEAISEPRGGEGVRRSYEIKLVK